MAKKKIGIYGNQISTANNKVEDLYLIVDEQSITFSVKNHVTNEYVAFESFCNTNENVGWNQLVAYLQNNSKLIQSIYRNIHFVLNTPRVILSKKQEKIDLTIYLNELNMVHGEKYDQEINVSPIGIASALVYSVPDVLNTLFSRSFPTGKWSHYLAFLIEQKLTAGVFVQLFENNFCVLILKDDQIKLIQYYPLQGDDQNSYTLLNACVHAGIEPNISAIEFTGYHPEHTAWADQVMSYFAQATIRIAPSEGIGDALNKEYPHHTFATYFIF